MILFARLCQSKVRPGAILQLHEDPEAPRCPSALDSGRHCCVTSSRALVKVIGLNTMKNEIGMFTHTS